MFQTHLFCGKVQRQGWAFSELAFCVGILKMVGRGKKSKISQKSCLSIQNGYPVMAPSDAESTSAEHHLIFVWAGC